MDGECQIEENCLFHFRCYPASAPLQQEQACEVGEDYESTEPPAQIHRNYRNQDCHEHDPQEDVAEDDLGLVDQFEPGSVYPFVDHRDKVDHFICRNLIEDKEVGLAKLPMPQVKLARAVREANNMEQI